MGFNLSNLLYLITIVTFILALRFLSNPAHARRGNQIGAVGMLVAIVVTWIKTGSTSWWAIAAGMLIGGGFGAVAARRVKMTAMPQMVALFNGVGGGAAALIALAELHRILPEPGHPKLDIGVAIALSGLIGAISFSGSMVAFAKLQELIKGRPITYPGQKFVNLALLAVCVGLAVALVSGVQDEWLLWVVIGGAAVFGVLAVLLSVGGLRGLAPLEHLEHPVGDDEAADDVRRPEHDREEADDPVEGVLVRRAEDDHRADDDDAVDGIGARHQRRVEQRRHLRDHLDAEEDREHEDRQLENEQRVVAHRAEPLAAAPNRPVDLDPPPWVGLAVPPPSRSTLPAKFAPVCDRTVPGSCRFVPRPVGCAGIGARVTREPLPCASRRRRR